MFMKFFLISGTYLTGFELVNQYNTTTLRKLSARPFTGAGAYPQEVDENPAAPKATIEEKLGGWSGEGDRIWLQMVLYVFCFFIYV